MNKLDTDYLRLVQRFPLLHINSDDLLNGAQEIIDVLVGKMASNSISIGEKQYLDALSDLVAAYERKRFHNESLTAVELVQHLMAENGLTQVDLAPFFGAQSRVSDFLSGKRELSKSQIEKLSQRFQLSPAAFFVRTEAVS
jgi:HTH-type transcriptional regulator / antitoxin HigA